VRYTYACTEEGSTSKRRITLFKDIVGKAGVTTSTSNFQSLRIDSPVVYITTTPIANTATGSEEQPNFNLLAITANGAVLCFDRETVTEQWRALSSTYSCDACTVEFAQSALATEVMDGFFNGKSDFLGFSAEKIAKDTFDPDVLVLITSRTTATGATQRELVVLAVPDESQAQNNASQGRVFQISTAILSNPREASPGPHKHYRVHVESGSVQELAADQLLTYTVEDGVPKLAHTLPVPNGTSFLRLSDSSVLTATTTTLSVYNPAYRALQASTHLDFSRDLQTSVKGDEAQYHLITYFPRLEIALGIRGSTLFAAQLEAPKTRKRKRRAEGLLIDSIGRGIPQAGEGQKWSRPDDAPAMFANYLPGSLSEEYCQEWEKDSATADKLFYEKDVAAFEKLVAEKFGVHVTPTKAVNGTPAGDAATGDNAMDVDTAGGEEQVLAVEEDRPVDRRWVIFTISRVFALTTNQEGGLAQVRLSCQLPRSNVANYLIDAGHLSISNVKSAFSEETRETHDVDAVLGEQIPQMIASLDPTLELLVEYLQATKLGPVELLASIRLIMRSLDLVQDPAKLSQKQITFGETENGANGEDDEVLGQKLDKLVEDLEVTEYHLLDDSSTRARGLTVAFGLLGSCSSVATIQAIRRLFRPEETLSLIHVLRVELVKGGWTARYLDGDEDEQDAPPDDSIRLLADLLCRCIDSVGPGGWMINDKLLARTGDHLDSADFLAGLKLEVSAALEGIQEAIYLRGLLTETVKYGNSVQKAVGEAASNKATPHKGVPSKDTPSKATPHRRSAKGNKAIRKLQLPDGENQMLPLGLGTKHGVSSTKVVAGGEIVTRSKREIGHLVSQRVGAYSLERIVV
jgi:hypothetical protein